VIRGRGTTHPKPEIVITKIWEVEVAVDGPRTGRIGVPRTAPHHPPGVCFIQVFAAIIRPIRIRKTFLVVDGKMLTMERKTTLRASKNRHKSAEKVKIGLCRNDFYGVYAD
jgi:hypothetical protein